MSTNQGLDLADGGSVRLRLQGLPPLMQVLAVAALAEGRSENASFTAKSVVNLFVELRVPPVGNLSATISRLRARALIMSPAAGTWSLTPAGEERLQRDAYSVSPKTLTDDLMMPDGADFGEVRHSTIPPFLGPESMSVGIQEVLARSPFENNVMLITRFPKVGETQMQDLIEGIRGAVASYNLTLHVASDANARDTLWENVVTFMWACKYAIVLVDADDGQLNSNVMIEIGGMLMTGRRCAIIRDSSVPSMPSDLVGHIYKSADLSDHAAAVGVIEQWIEKDLGLGGARV